MPIGRIGIFILRVHRIICRRINKVKLHIILLKLCLINTPTTRVVCKSRWRRFYAGYKGLLCRQWGQTESRHQLFFIRVQCVSAHPPIKVCSAAYCKFSGQPCTTCVIFESHCFIVSGDVHFLWKSIQAEFSKMMSSTFHKAVVWVCTVQSVIPILTGHVWFLTSFHLRANLWSKFHLDFLVR